MPAGQGGSELRRCRHGLARVCLQMARSHLRRRLVRRRQELCVRLRAALTHADTHFLQHWVDGAMDEQGQRLSQSTSQHLNASTNNGYAGPPMNKPASPKPAQVPAGSMHGACALLLSLARLRSVLLACSFRHAASHPTHDIAQILLRRLHDEVCRPRWRRPRSASSWVCVTSS